VDATGPDHDKVFRVEVAVGGRRIGVGEGHSRRMAETAAAARAIEALREEPGTLGAGAEDAPELVRFEPLEGESQNEEWETGLGGARSDEAPEEPWTELDIDLASVELAAQSGDEAEAPRPEPVDRRQPKSGESSGEGR
jgi:hypothetical protein